MAALSYNELLQSLIGIRDERRTHANTADRVGTAMIELLSYLNDAPYLRKDQEDATSYLLHLIAGAVIGQAGEIRLNPDGSISCGRIFVDGSAVFRELVINHQNVLEGDTYFTDRGIIDTMEYAQNGEIRLVMRKMHDNDRLTFHVNDVLRCAMNNLDTSRTYRTSWMRVNSIDLGTNSMNVVLYDDEDVPGGRNYAPAAAARMIRWGNSLDPARQNVFFVSAEDGRFLFLQGVTQPKIDQTNYSAFIGVPPDLDILQDLPINKRHPYIYARGLIVQDIIRLDYQGNPVYTSRDCGIWDNTRQYIHGYDSIKDGYYTDHVWWGGCFWRASVSLPTVGREPRFNNTDWTCLLGGANMSLEIVSTAGDGFRANTHWQTTLVVAVYNAEMQLTEAEIGLMSITWMRISSDADGDEVWNTLHPTGSCGLSLPIDSDTDVPGSWDVGSSVAYRCKVAIPEIATKETEYLIEL